MQTWQVSTEKLTYRDNYIYFKVVCQAILTLTSNGIVSMGKIEWLTKLGWYGAHIKHSTVGLGNNHETMIIVPSWSYDNHTVEIF